MQEGYNLLGSSQRVCSSAGLWTGSAPSCLSKSLSSDVRPNTDTCILVVDCGTPGISPEGDIPSMLAYSTTIFNSTVTYSCEIGHDIMGDIARTCLASGQWSGSAPECHSKLCKHKYKVIIFVITVVTCESLFIPSGTIGGLTVLFDDVIYNSTATYQCNEIGYELIGLPERKCEANGNWSNAQPTCQCNNACMIMQNIAF